ncbi:trypsin delta-like [Anopheles marshallii]|uniref:trypsin delta-like n=1 Tax=Anopheles marshallii TaxID=1521116 RepID=UPI00237BAC39|nr:trypsin delta-like [Anopheles marshallii]
MKQVIGLVLLGLIRSNVVLAGDGTQANGVSHSGRIVNGVAVNIANYVYAVNMYHNNMFFCGASIITFSHALTAGHCMNDRMNDIAKIIVHGGSISPTTGGFFFQVVRIALHGGYNPNTLENDAAIVTVPTNAFSGKPNMGRIALQFSEMSVGTPCFVVGWGRTNINVPAPTSELRYAQMNILSQASCNAAWASYQIRFTSNMFCAKYGNGVDVCKGDSGGALVCEGRLTGIASFTNPDCNSALPAGFAKVIDPSIRNFIRSQAGI